MIWLGFILHATYYSQLVKDATQLIHSCLNLFLSPSSTDQ